MRCKWSKKLKISLSFAGRLWHIGFGGWVRIVRATNVCTFSLGTSRFVFGLCFFFIFIRLSFPFHILNVVGVDCFFLIFSAFILYFFHSLTVVGIDGNSMLLLLWLIYSHCCRFVLLAVLPLLTEMQSSFFASYFYCCCHGKTIYVCVFQRCGKYGDYQFDW